MGQMYCNLQTAWDSPFWLLLRLSTLLHLTFRTIGKTHGIAWKPKLLLCVSFIGSANLTHREEKPQNWHISEIIWIPAKLNKVSKSKINIHGGVHWTGWRWIRWTQSNPAPTLFCFFCLFFFQMDALRTTVPSTTLTCALAPKACPAPV